MASRSLDDLAAPVKSAALAMLARCRAAGLEVLIYCTLRSNDEQAALWRMLAQGARFRPYDAEALRFYCENAGPDTAVTPQKAQNALESLRQRTPALVWKSARGEHAVEDAAMHRWLRRARQLATGPR